MKKLLDEGLDIYIMDWGYPKKQHKYLTMDDYILEFMGLHVNLYVIFILYLLFS